MLRFPAPTAIGTVLAAFQVDEAIRDVACTLNSGNATVAAAGGSRAAVPCNSSERTLKVPPVRHGRHELVVAATDRAGNVGESQPVVWDVDIEAPAVELWDVVLVGSTLTAAVVVEPGAFVSCTLSGLVDGEANSTNSTAASRSRIEVHGCNPRGDSCGTVAVVGPAPHGIAGPYAQRACDGDEASSAAGSPGPCLRSGRPVYDQRDGDAVLTHVDGRWTVRLNGTAVVSVKSSAERPDQVKQSASWSSSGSVAGGPAATWAEMHVLCNSCGATCQQASYERLPTGLYTLCASARDALGNQQAQPTCVGGLEVVAEASQRATLEVASFASVERCRLALKEWPIAVAAIVAFGMFVAAFSVWIYVRRRAAAIALAVQHKQSAILTSTLGFKEAQLVAEEMAY
jgi:hypothetical protein